MDVKKELKKRAFTITLAASKMALMRFVRKEVLGRDGLGTSKDPWKYKNK